MRLLVTNDDGIDCVFLHELVHGPARRGHELAVAAPKTEELDQRGQVHAPARCADQGRDPRASAAPRDR